MTLQARAGIARAGASRAGWYVPNVVLVIAGVDRSTSLQPGLRVSLALNDEPDTAVFKLLPDEGFTPVIGQHVAIHLGAVGNPEFAGQIDRIVRSYERGVVMDDGTTPAPVITVHCIDWLRLFNRRLVTQEWRGQSATLIARELLAFSSGFTGDAIEADLETVDQFICINETLGSAMKRLATQIRGGYYIDPNRDVHLFGPTGESGPRAGTAPLSLTPSRQTLELLSAETDGTQIRTRVIVEGQETRCPVGTPSGDETVIIDATAAVDYLVVGGGGGGAGSLGGGGGAGGVVQGTDVLGSGTYPVVIGAGGAAASAGNPSSFNLHTATGGGRGGDTSNAGGSGGSGGGGGATTAAGSGTAGQGYAGGAGYPNLAGAGGGGGGAMGVGSAAGVNVSGTLGGNGGPGVASSITGSLAYYGGGGGGNGSAASGAGGLGGGGRGGAGGNPSLPGTANTGGGGGGGGTSGGGSGVVVLSYPTGAISATGGTITTAGGRTIHTFTSSADFVVSAVVYTAPAPVVTDLPLEDGARIDPAGGTVRIGPHVLTYLSTFGPTVDPGANLPGSTVTADAALLSTTLTVADISVFADAYGWVKVGDQIVRYGSKSGSNLQEIPATGFGSLQAPVKADSQITWLPAIRLSDTGVLFSPSLNAGERVVQRLVVDDAAAQALIAAIEGGDGVHEHPVSDSKLNVDGMLAVATKELAAFAKTELLGASWQTFDANARPGRVQAVAYGETSVALIVTRVELTWPHPNQWPRRRCEAALVRQAEVIDVLTKR